MPISIGVLALQGGYKEVAAALLRQPGVVPSFVRTSQELRGVAALVIPGGESTTIGRLLELSALLEPLREFARSHPVFGICAGLIVLSDALAPAPGGAGAGGGADADSGDPTTTEQQQAPSPLVGGLDITISRNHFGRQSRSAFRQLVLTAAGRAAGVSAASYFIRAPAVVRVGAGVEVLAEVVAGDSVATVAVAVRAGHLLGVAFHPEVHNDDSYIRFFVRELCGFTPTAADAALRPSVPFVAPPMVSVGTPTTPATAAVAAQPPSTTGATTSAVKRAFPVFQQGGVIMDVVNPEQARIAEAAGAVSVMALERIPADIKRDGGLARMSDPALILGIRAAVSIPVMAKARIGHFAEARVLEALDVDCVDESEVLTPADETHHIDKRGFRIPFVCGAKSLGEALRRIAEGASMIRLKGNAGTGNVVQAVRHARQVFAEIRQLQGLRADEVFVFAKEHRVPVALVEQVRAAGRLPVVTFAAGGLATPADVSLLMHLGCDGVFVGSGIFKGENPAERARAMVQACAHFQDARVVARVSTNLGKAMVGLLDNGERYAAMGVNSDSLL